MDKKPTTFSEKLDLLAQLFSDGQDLRPPEEEIARAEARLHTTFPDPLRDFYLRLGKGGPLFSEAQNTIFTPEELLNYTVEDEDADENEDLSPEELLALGGDLVLAEENQTVWFCRLDQTTGIPYLDMGDGEREELHMDLEETLLWLLVMNIATDEAFCGGDCTAQDMQSLQDKLGEQFLPLTQGKGMVFVLPERSIAGVQAEADSFWLGALDDEALEALEEDTGLEFGWF